MAALGVAVDEGAPRSWEVSSRNMAPSPTATARGGPDQPYATSGESTKPPDTAPAREDVVRMDQQRLSSAGWKLLLAAIAIAGHTDAFAALNKQKHSSAAG